MQERIRMKGKGKLLIANRGIVAVRVAESARKLGYAVAAVYTERDKDALHVTMADEAHCVSSYLDIAEMIRVARTCGAGALHAGWGYRSEDPEFARACQKAGILWIGAFPECMEKMGDKVVARKIAKEAGLPVLPGVEVDSEEQAIAEAQKIGFPLMVKAAGGGGGIGIFKAYGKEELRAVFHRARGNAERHFGNGKLFLERFLPAAWHIEVQVLGDEQGNIVHLFERDCSIQLGNQKRIEEAPAPAAKLDIYQRRRLWAYALQLTRFIGYANLGTVEFLVTPEGEMYFLEMNTRLQVEHRVTELVTGVDLVELQIRVAQGESLPFQQRDIQAAGHALEVRLCKEKLNSGGEIVPAAGRLEWNFHPQAVQKGGALIDSGIAPCARHEFSLDSASHFMNAVVRAGSRELAIVHMERLLDQLNMYGDTNKNLLRFFLRSPYFPSFFAGLHTTFSLQAFLQFSRAREEIEKRDRQERLAQAAAAGELAAGEFRSDAHDLLFTE